MRNQDWKYHTSPSTYTQNNLFWHYYIQVFQEQRPLLRTEWALFGEMDGDMIFKNDFCTHKELYPSSLLAGPREGKGFLVVF